MNPVGAYLLCRRCADQHGRLTVRRPWVRFLAGAFLWSLHVLPMFVRVSYEHSGFCPLSGFRLIDGSKLPIVSVCGYLSHYVSLVIN